jgi:hypothetical protein
VARPDPLPGLGVALRDNDEKRDLGEKTGASDRARTGDIQNHNLGVTVSGCFLTPSQVAKTL